MPKKHLYLPKIIDGANIDEPVVNSLWEDKQKRIIQSIGDGIEVDEAARSRGISSIPDIYARPLTFLSAFRSEKHPLRDRIIQEWRGLISLLALHRVKPDLSNITITPVELKEDKLSKALKNLSPKSIQLQKNGTEYAWTDILLIKFNEIPIGAFSPATLVYTSSDYNNKLSEKSFSLKDNQGFLKAPTKREDLEYVGEWLEWFIKEFNDNALLEDGSSLDYKYSGDINFQLQNWLDDIRRSLGIEGTEPIDAQKVVVATSPIPLTKSIAFFSKYKIYQALLTPLVKDEDNIDGLGKSDYSLNIKRNYTGHSEIVLVNQALLDRDKNLWDGTSPGELDREINTLIKKFFKEASGSKINRINLENHKAIWIRPELYFVSDTLIRNRKGENILNFKESSFNAGSDYLLPFNKEILHYFSPEDIHEYLKPKFIEADGKVTFSFTLHLKDGSSIEIKKVFKEKGEDKALLEGKIINIDVPVLEIFPNYLGDFWCQYFMLCSDTDNFVAEPLNFDRSASNISINRQEQKYESNNSRYKADVIKIFGYNSFPEAVSFTKKDGSQQLNGLILLKREADIADRPFNGRCTVGIDFGTSNTNIYKYSGEIAQRWKFSFTKYLRSITNSPVDKRKEVSQLFFVPTVDFELPTPTALRIFKPGVVSNMVLDHFLYFPFDSRYPHNVHTNIKWDEDESKNLFIKSLVFLLLIDLIQDRVAKIEFRCSYPKSFSDNRKIAYQGNWNNALEELFHAEVQELTGNDLKLSANSTTGYKSDGIAIPDAENKLIFTHVKKFNKGVDYFEIDTLNNGRLSITVKPKFTTEGIAAGEYFSSQSIIQNPEMLADREGGSICIDVGGGTTDYSIWFESEIKYDASVLLAGKQVARLIKNNSRIRDLLFSEDSSEALNEVRDNEELFSSRLNYILNKEEKSITSKLTNQSSSRDIAWLRKILAIEFGALSFYAAHLCLYLDECVGGKLSKSIEKSGVMLHWGGNASKFINWIDYGKYDKDGIASKFLNGMFINTIMDKSLVDRAFKPADLGQIQSPGHKDEASGGIVVMDFAAKRTKKLGTKFDGIILEEDDTEDDLEKLVIGEEVVIGDKNYEHYSAIRKHGFFNSNHESLFGETKLTQLERFIHLINFVGKKTGLIPEGNQIELSDSKKLAIQRNIKNDLAAMARLDPDDRNIEPIFIMEIKYLLDILSNEMK